MSSLSDRYEGIIQRVTIRELVIMFTFRLFTGNYKSQGNLVSFKVDIIDSTDFQRQGCLIASGCFEAGLPHSHNITGNLVCQPDTNTLRLNISLGPVSSPTSKCWTLALPDTAKEAPKAWPPLGPLSQPHQNKDAVTEFPGTAPNSLPLPPLPDSDPDKLMNDIHNISRSPVSVEVTRHEAEAAEADVRQQAAEVNDRCERVENQLKVYEGKFEVLKNNYDVKMIGLQTTKVHNTKLLSIASSSHSDTGHTARLEELLASERTKNKSLQDRLDNPEKLSSKTEPLVVPVTHGAVMMDSSSNETVMVPHTQSEEYSYLSSLLTNTQRSNEELKQQLKEQFRLSLEDSDKIREMTRKVNMLETERQKLKAQNYTLKINIDELKCKKGEQKIQKKEPVRIYEKLVFEKKTEAPPPENSNEDPFILKESISNIKAPAAKTKSPEKHSSLEKENFIGTIDTEVKDDKPRKKVACFAESVETITAEGEKDTEVLATKEAGEKAGKRPSKPQGKKKFGAANSVFVGDQDTAAECKQQ